MALFQRAGAKVKTDSHKSRPVRDEDDSDSDRDDRVTVDRSNKGKSDHRSSSSSATPHKANKPVVASSSNGSSSGKSKRDDSKSSAVSHKKHSTSSKSKPLAKEAVDSDDDDRADSVEEEEERLPEKHSKSKSTNIVAKKAVAEDRAVAAPAKSKKRKEPEPVESSEEVAASEDGEGASTNRSVAFHQFTLSRKVCGVNQKTVYNDSAAAKAELFDAIRDGVQQMKKAGQSGDTEFIPDASVQRITELLGGASSEYAHRMFCREYFSLETAKKKVPSSKISCAVINKVGSALSNPEQEAAGTAFVVRTSSGARDLSTAIVSVASPGSEDDFDITLGEMKRVVATSTCPAAGLLRKAPVKDRDQWNARQFIMAYLQTIYAPKLEAYDQRFRDAVTVFGDEPLHGDIPVETFAGDMEFTDGVFLGTALDFALARRLMQTVKPFKVRKVNFRKAGGDVRETSDDHKADDDDDAATEPNDEQDNASAADGESDQEPEKPALKRDREMRPPAAKRPKKTETVDEE